MHIPAATHLVPQDIQLCHWGDVVAAGHRLTGIIDHHHRGIGIRAVEHHTLAGGNMCMVSQYTRNKQCMCFGGIPGDKYVIVAEISK
jgi:hypothetical protein